jgi:hypothetical protein
LWRRPWQLTAFVLWAVALVLLIVRRYVDAAWPEFAWAAVVGLSVVCIVISERRGERLVD